MSWNCALKRCASSTTWLASQHPWMRYKLPLLTLISSPHVVTEKLSISENSFTELVSVKSWRFFQYSALFALPFWQQNSNCFPDYFSLFNIYVSTGILGIWEADGPNEGWICERVILMYETSEDELSRKRGSQQEPQKEETKNKRNNA